MNVRELSQRLKKLSPNTTSISHIAGTRSAEVADSPTSQVQQDNFRVARHTPGIGNPFATIRVNVCQAFV